MEWQELKNNIKDLAELVNEKSANKVARDFGLANHRAVTYHLKKHGYEYEDGLWQRPGGIVKNDMGDRWFLEHNGKTLEISKEDYKNIRDDYCDELGTDYLSIREVCKKYGLTRDDFLLLKSAFNFTHYNIHYVDEEVAENSTDELAEQTLEDKKRMYFEKLSSKEVDYFKKELRKYQKKEYLFRQTAEMVDDHFKDFRRGYKAEKIEYSGEGRPVMLEVPIVDMHLGKLAWAPEVGEHYDLKIAERKFEYIIDEVISRVKNQNIERVILPVGNDFFHVDNPENKTSRGTAQDVDSRWQKMYLLGIELLVKSIDKLRQLAEAKILLVPGNHDWSISFYAVNYLEGWFKDCPDVYIDTDPTARKYEEYGKNLIGFTHGDKEKRRIFGCMQSEAPEAWGRTKYREFHCGHLHSEQIKEDMGVVVRQLPSPTAKDAWHYQKGYQAIPRVQSFIWDKTRGLTNIIVINMLECAFDETLDNKAG
ncbi:hypothetical protein [Halarsenatibacter silvermanii]|uniref:Calcineurin-like phosphoesterase n=1 Tax=Halarsenatibacter silvermanii TaxID=321763 RepID=A0A1G9RA94_9FIRM|nr:hypothetical protein [Halarsenatibacter silvermanii]SDM20061.1 hypothetical protein SAMN04488692_12113 [Halarsenatibacter silvermanii]